jgi:hypothetical protein
MRIHFTLLAVLGLALAGCTTPYRTPVARAASGTAQFEGVTSLLREDRPLDVLLVHGMCTHDEGWAKKAARSLYASLGGDGALVRLLPASVPGTAVTLYQQTLQLPTGSLRLNALLWSPLTSHLKGDLCFDQTVKGPACIPGLPQQEYLYERATANRTFKDGLLNDCLSDAIIYQGVSRDQISSQIQKGILQAIATSGAARRTVNAAADAAGVAADIPLVVITSSLGSKVTFDALYRLRSGAQTASAGTAVTDRIAHVYMAANQLPILGLADRSLDGSTPEAGRFPANAVGEFVAHRRARAEAAKIKLKLQVVAFTDPNDLLSYALVSAPHTRIDGVIDVIVSNDVTYFGFLERPDNAHRDYLKNQSVNDRIACGHRPDGSPSSAPACVGR